MLQSTTPPLSMHAKSSAKSSVNSTIWHSKPVAVWNRHPPSKTHSNSLHRSKSLTNAEGKAVGVSVVGPDDEGAVDGAKLVGPNDEGAVDGAKLGADEANWLQSAKPPSPMQSSDDLHSIRPLSSWKRHPNVNAHWNSLHTSKNDDEGAAVRAADVDGAEFGVDEANWLQSAKPPCSTHRDPASSVSHAKPVSVWKRQAPVNAHSNSPVPKSRLRPGQKSLE